MTVACTGLPGQPRDEAGPVFSAPWEAQAFAMVVVLHEQAWFTWSEWAQTLASQIASAQDAGDADLGDTYYRHWLAALETLIAAKGIGSQTELMQYREAWTRAAEHTPHGQPIELPTTLIPSPPGI